MQDASRDGIDHRLRRLHELPERVDVAAPGPKDEIAQRIHVVTVHGRRQQPAENVTQEPHYG
jgi:hypothetical protein